MATESCFCISNIFVLAQSEAGRSQINQKHLLNLKHSKSWQLLVGWKSSICWQTLQIVYCALSFLNKRTVQIDGYRVSLLPKLTTPEQFTTESHGAASLQGGCAVRVAGCSTGRLYCPSH